MFDIITKNAGVNPLVRYGFAFNIADITFFAGLILLALDYVRFRLKGIVIVCFFLINITFMYIGFDLMTTARYDLFLRCCGIIILLVSLVPVRLSFRYMSRLVEEDAFEKKPPNPWISVGVS